MWNELFVESMRASRHTFLDGARTPRLKMKVMTHDQKTRGDYSILTLYVGYLLYVVLRSKCLQCSKFSFKLSFANI